MTLRIVGEAAFTDEPDTNSYPLQIGGYDDAGAVLDGIVDDAAVFDVGLEEDEVQEIMEMGLAERFQLDLAVTPSGRLTTTWGGVKGGRVKN